MMYQHTNVIIPVLTELPISSPRNLYHPLSALDSRVVMVASVHAPRQRNSTYVQTIRRSIYWTRQLEHPHWPIRQYLRLPQRPPPRTCYTETYLETTLLYATSIYTSTYMSTSTYTSMSTSTYTSTYMSTSTSLYISAAITITTRTTPLRQ